MTDDALGRSGARTWRALRAACVLSLAMASSQTAFAQTSPTDTALAEELYQQGKRLMNEGRHAEACPKLAESQRLAPAMGTLLTLAVCHEGAGKLASAWAEFTDVLPAARRANRPDRAQYAEQRIAAIAPRLSRLKVVVSPEAQVPGLVVELNGNALNTATLGVAAPVDGGQYTVSASAPGKEKWAQQITVKPEKDQQVVNVPPLQTSTPAAAETPPAAPAAAPPSSAAPESANVANVGAETHGPTRVPFYVAVGATAALTTAAAVTGVIALGRASDFKDANKNPAFTQDERQSLRDRATSMGTISTVFAVGALAGAATSVYLFVSQKNEPSAQGLRVLPMAAPGVAGLQLVGVR
jgi:hypothetical protein